MFTKRSFNGWKDSFYYPPVPIAHATFRSFEIFLLSCYRYILAWQLVDLTLELLLVFIPGLIWFFDWYLKFLLLSYIPSANAPFTLLFSKALSTNLFNILPACTSSLVTSREMIFLFLPLTYHFLASNTSMTEGFKDSIFYR